MTNITLNIPNISCNHCIHTIKTEVGDLAGVKNVEGSVQMKQVIIGFDEPATREKIEALLAEIDYPVAK